MTELDVLQAIAARLALITVANGYASDAGLSVAILRDAYSRLDATPFLGLRLESREALDGATLLVGCPTLRLRLNLEIIGVVELDEDNSPDRPLALIDDIDHVLHAPAAAQVLSPLGITLTPVLAVVLPAEDGDAHTELQVQITAEFCKRLAA